MDLKKILFSIFAIIWTIGVIAQQTYWISIGSYSIVAFIWALIELGLLYIIFKMIEEN